MQADRQQFFGIKGVLKSAEVVVVPIAGDVDNKGLIKLDPDVLKRDDLYGVLVVVRAKAASVFISFEPAEFDELVSEAPIMLEDGQSATFQFSSDAALGTLLYCAASNAAARLCVSYVGITRAPKGAEDR